jgi:hypothetical protein
MLDEFVGRLNLLVVFCGYYAVSELKPLYILPIPHGKIGERLEAFAYSQLDQCPIQ